MCRVQRPSSVYGHMATCEHGDKPLGLLKLTWFAWLNEILLVSQKGLCYRE
jgi:hypothetical protein